MNPEIDALIDGYFNLRLNSKGLRQDGVRFEGQEWRQEGESAVRYSTGHKLIISRVEGDIEACVIFPDGTTKTFA